MCEVNDLRWLTYPWVLMEDLGEYIATMERTPASPQEMSAILKHDYGVELSEQISADVLWLVRARN